MTEYREDKDTAAVCPRLCFFNEKIADKWYIIKGKREVQAVHYTYCPRCGSKLGSKILGDEGAVPYCENCQKPWFDGFSTCIIVLVTNGMGQVVLLQQDYLSTRYRTLVSGYMKPGESAEETALREVQEEIGLRLRDLRLMRTLWFPKGDMLMIAFIGQAEGEKFTLSREVNGAQWVDAQQAIHMVHPNSPGNASYYLVQTYLEELQKQQNER